MNTTSLNKSRIIKLSKAGSASENNWKKYISTCAGNVSSITSIGTSTGGSLGGLLNSITSNLIEGQISSETGDYPSFLSKPGNLESLMGAGSIGEALNVDPEVELVANHDWKLNTIGNKYEKVTTANSLVSKFLSGGSPLGDAISGVKDILNTAAMVSAAAGSNNSLYNYSTQTWWKNLEGWTGTDPVSIQFTFDFALGQYGLWNAKKEVVIPMLNLIAMFCPSLIADGSMIGPTATPTGMLYSVISDALAPVADQIEGLLGGDIGGIKNLAESTMGFISGAYSSGAKEGNNTLTSTLNGIASLLGGVTAEAVTKVSDKLLKVLENSTYNVQVGDFMSISNCICTGINSVSFANKVDEFGYPISGSVNLVLRGVIPPTFSGTRQELITLRFGGV